MRDEDVYVTSVPRDVAVVRHAEELSALLLELEYNAQRLKFELTVFLEKLEVFVAETRQ